MTASDALAASFFIRAVGLASVTNNPMGDRYRHHVPIDFRSYPNYDPTPAVPGQPVTTQSNHYLVTP